MDEKRPLNEILRLLNEIEPDDAMTNQVLEDAISQIQTLRDFGKFQETQINTSTILREDLSNNSSHILEFERISGVNTSSGRGNIYRFTIVEEGRTVDCEPSTTVSSLQNRL